jgi:hypothetical protein
LVINLTQAVKTAPAESSCPNGVAYSSLRWDGGSKYEPPACADRGKLGEKKNTTYRTKIVQVARTKTVQVTTTYTKGMKVKYFKIEKHKGHQGSK